MKTSTAAQRSRIVRATKAKGARDAADVTSLQSLMNKARTIARNPRLLLCFVMASTFIFSALGNLYRWVNNTAFHDGLQLNMASDIWWQLALGRFIVPAYEFIRGFISSPFVVGILATLFIGLLVYCVVRCLDIRSPFLVLGIAAVFSANAVLVQDYGWYTQFTDIQMCSYFLSALALFIVLFGKRLWPAAFVPLLIAIGLYQVSLMFIATLALLVFIKTLVSNEGIKKVGEIFLKVLIITGVALVFYFLCANYIIGIVNWGEISYDAGLSHLSISNFFDVQRLAATFIIPILYLLHPQIHLSQFVGILNGLLMIAFIVGLIYLGVKRDFKARHWIVLAICVILLPCAATCFYWFTKDPLYERMILSVWLFYPAVAMVVMQASKILKADFKARKEARSALAGTATLQADEQSRNRMKAPRGNTPPQFVLQATLLTTFMVIFGLGAIYSNDVYLRKDLENEARLSMMTRLAERMDETEGYSPGRTQVAFIGSLDDNLLYKDARPHFPPQNNNRSRFVAKYTELYMDSLVHEETIGWGQLCYLWYFDFYLGYPIAILEDTNEVAETAEVKAMPAFPSKDCCEIVNGYLVVKLS